MRGIFTITGQLPATTFDPRSGSAVPSPSLEPTVVTTALTDCYCRGAIRMQVRYNPEADAMLVTLRSPRRVGGWCETASRTVDR